MTTASEIEQLAMDVFDNKESYKDNEYIIILNILKESYMKVKGLSSEFVNEKETEYPGIREVDSDLESEVDETDDEYFLRTHRYEGYDDDGEESYLSPY